MDRQKMIEEIKKILDSPYPPLSLKALDAILKEVKMISTIHFP